MSNRNTSQSLNKAKNEKNDEFYTQYSDIEKEIQAYLDFNPNAFKDKTVLLPCDDPEWSNFTRYFVQNFIHLGLKKLISTSYASPQNEVQMPYQSRLFELDDLEYDKQKLAQKGKIFTLTSESNAHSRINVDDLEWKYLQGDGDFRSDEIKVLRDEVDMIITNPPFSLFREFLAWIMEVDKEFAIIGNMNAITYKDVFPLIQANKMWLGATISSGDREFRVPDNYPLNAVGTRIDEQGNKYIRVKGVRWFTNIEHGRRHKPLQLMTMSDNFKFNKSLSKTRAYKEYDNYKAIEVPRTNAIPSDYQGIMGVPISFLDKYNPEQFEILGMDFYVKDGFLNSVISENWNGKLDRAYLNGERLYSRVLISHKGI
ncbi:DNA methyltransferase [Ignatzschineria ureiclastica]|uniref:DNA methyltransferase n=1 Tax=Ignatzschineria ureiclastica TaxID=472582 RepID=A0A2U2ACN2_9GAMM|nr:adenine-specific methyltransferase EcoRI family protein [Ignatzschineria ureiclastica]PWD80377.1 DNA methyltransferase [Ignatzschineria ureiclastica]GGZ99953.1 putative adenine-specific methylase [Ignatzschineria ureiclastica]